MTAEMNQVQAPQLIEESSLIIEHLGEDVTFGREYKDNEMRIVAHHGWSSGTLKIEYKGALVLHQRFGQTHRTDHADPHPHILTYLYRPDSGPGWYEHLQALFETAKKREQLKLED